MSTSKSANDAGRSPSVGSLLKVALAGARNAATLLPGERPEWVVVDLTGSVVARIERPRFMGIPLPSPDDSGPTSLDAIVTTLDELARASWLRGVLFRFDGFSASAAVAYALRRAIQRLGAAGKDTTAYVTHLDATTYYVATGAREIVAPESAEIALRGFGVSITFLGEGLARLGLRFEKVAIAEYKNAFDNLARSEISPAHKEQLEVLLERAVDHHATVIGEARGITKEAYRALLDEGVSSASRALSARLIDRVAYEHALLDPTQPKHVPLAHAKRFLAAKIPPMRPGRVAVIWITGGIISGRSRRMPGFGSMTGSDTVIRAIRAAGRDASTRAVVLAVDSPGGSALASDLIDREVQILGAKKPVVAVMGAVAASGGYYVSAHAAKIIAAPTTITGSIGVLTGKLTAAELLGKLGLHTARLERGRFAHLLDPTKALDDQERALLQRSNEEVYGRFVARVADGRKLSDARVRELAKGRVWAGVDALAHGLVDELGDLEVGLARARELGGLSVDAPSWVVEPSREVLLSSSVDDAAALARLVLGQAGQAGHVGARDSDTLRFVALTLSSEHAWAIAPAWLRLG